MASGSSVKMPDTTSTQSGRIMQSASKRPRMSPQRRNGDVALRIAGLGNHLEARQDDVTEHHDGAATKHGLRQGIEHFHTLPHARCGWGRRS